MKKQRLQFKTLLAVWGIFLLLAAILFAWKLGVQYTVRARVLTMLPREETVTAQAAAQSLPKDTLVVWDSRNPSSALAWEQFRQILLDMKVGYDTVNLAQGELPEFNKYDRAVLLISNVSTLGETLLDLSRWVYDGGSALFPVTLEKEEWMGILERKLGITSSGYGYSMVEKIYVGESFMLGGGRSYAIDEPFESAWSIQLEEDVQVCAWTDDQRKLPLIWKNQYGAGSFVVDNFGIYNKVVRGLYAASFSLLGDVSTYPVINGAAFYLDDFPSPVPSGDGKYVRQDYGTDISGFYTNIWWPDMLDMAREHNVRYTGVVIENYEDHVDGTITNQESTWRFQYFGNMLLHAGGEIGYHGYNHQPLSLGDTDYGGILPYKTWDSWEAMASTVSELIRFEDDMYPGVEKSVYVPPSNVLSAEGRELLATEFPGIRTIASTYFEGVCAYAQEFAVAEDGIVEQPRIISGAVLDGYMQLAAFSELNMHYVSNHFIHPDDLLDEDRGAALGWETLKGRLDGYMDWLFDSAPSLRRFTGSELSGAVQRYCAVAPECRVERGRILLELSNFYDEAYLFVRVNTGTPGKVQGGTLEQLTGNLYLLHAQEDHVEIEYSEDGL